MTTHRRAEKSRAEESRAEKPAVDETAEVPAARTSPELDSAEIDDELDGDVVAAESGRVTGEEPGLDQRGRDILTFERQWWRHAGAKEQAIRERFGLSATRYYQLLNMLLDDPLAAAHDPALVARLRRLRTSRARRSS